MYPLKFTDADLTANRQGVLTDAQRKRLDDDVATIHKYNRYVMWAFGLSVGVLLIIGAMTQYNSVDGDLSRLMKPDSQTGFVMMGGTLLIIFGVLVAWNRWSVKRLEHGVVAFVEGKAQVISTYTTVRGMRVPMHRLYLQRGLFRRSTFYFPTAESLRHFKQDRVYRVYYVPYALRYPLSVEEIDEKDKRQA